MSGGSAALGSCGQLEQSFCSYLDRLGLFWWPGRAYNCLPVGLGSLAALSANRGPLVCGPFIYFGYAAECEGDYPKARQYYEEAYSIHREVNDTHGMAFSLRYLGNLDLASDPYHAKYYIKEALKLLYDASLSGDAVTLYNLGAAEVMLCQSLPHAERRAWLRRAALLFGAAGVRGDIFMDVSKIWLKHYPPALELLRSQLDADVLAAAWAEGAAMSVEEVYKYALEEDDPTHGPAENL